jgi:hypothetical protein
MKFGIKIIEKISEHEPSETMNIFRIYNIVWDVIPLPHCQIQGR